MQQQHHIQVVDPAVLTNITSQLLNAMKKSGSKEATNEREIFSLFKPIRGDGGLDSVEGLSGTITVELTFLLAPRPHRVPLYFELPHRVHHGSICFVTPPPQRKYKDLLMHPIKPSNNHDGAPSSSTTEQQQQGTSTTQQLSSDDIRLAVKKIIDSGKLTAKFGLPVEARALARSFDIFFVHTGVKRFPKVLTGEFLTHQTPPVWLPKHRNIFTSIRRGMHIAVVPRRGVEHVSVVIGDAAHNSVQQLVENTISLLSQLTSHRQGSPLRHILQARIGGKVEALKGNRLALPFFWHDFTAHLDPQTFRLVVDQQQKKPDGGRPSSGEQRKAVGQKRSSSAAAKDDQPPSARRSVNNNNNTAVVVAADPEPNTTADAAKKHRSEEHCDPKQEAVGKLSRVAPLTKVTPKPKSAPIRNVTQPKTVGQKKSSLPTSTSRPSETKKQTWKR